jgi:hypothetical protein
VQSINGLLRSLAFLRETNRWCEEKKTRWRQAAAAPCECPTKRPALGRPFFDSDVRSVRDQYFAAISIWG